MKHNYTQSFIAGSLGAVILVMVMYILKTAGMGEPGFVGMYRAMFHTQSSSDHVIAAILFILSGGLWGIVYAFIIKKPTILNGFLFGLVPTLWLWIVVNAAIDKPLFNGFALMGIIMPLIFNMVIWGSFTGWYLKNKLNRLKVA